MDVSVTSDVAIAEADNDNAAHKAEALSLTDE
jgi:hypothetical protein